MAIESRPGIKTGATILRDEKEAAEDLFNKLNQPNMGDVLFFCSSKYNLDKLGPELKRQFPCSLIGCTTAGEMSSSGYQAGGIVGASFSAPKLKLHSHVIHPLSRFRLAESQELAHAVRRELIFSDRLDKEKMFGLLLIDGMSILEEQITSFIYSQLEGVSILGGSAGDDLRFRETKLYADGKFLSNAACLTVFETLLPFAVFKTQHFLPTEKKMVITEADPSRRIVNEINAEPAAEEYARLLGISVTDLCPAIFSKYPLMIRVADGWHVRSIQKVNENGSLSFYCAIDTGLVITLAEGGDIITNLQNELARLSQAIPTPQLMIGCDCVLRKLEIMEKGLEKKVANLLMDRSFIGFSTYGEQFNSVHVNQTLTGVVIGG